jgi:HSP20 family molecular chaperone IbpA
MAYPNMFPTPYYFYPPELWQTTYINRSFPEHHLPFENARHKIASGIHDFVHHNYPAPKADIRETLNHYYIDIELPGIEKRDEIKLKWINSQSLFLEAEKTSRAVVEGDDSKTAKPEVSKEVAAPESQETNQGIQNDHEQKEDKPHHPVHNLVRERDLGKLKRAFNFSVSVDRESMSAKLHHGMLEITLAKKDDDKEPKTDVHVEHA